MDTELPRCSLSHAFGERGRMLVVHTSLGRKHGEFDFRKRAKQIPEQVSRISRVKQRNPDRKLSTDPYRHRLHGHAEGEGEWLKSKQPFPASNPVRKAATGERPP